MLGLLTEKEKRSSMLFLAVIGSIFVILMVSIINWFYKHDYKSGKQYLSDGWSVYINGKMYEDVDLTSFEFKSANKGDEIVIARKMPHVSKKQPTLVLYTMHSAVDVQLDGTSIYHYGVDRYRQKKVVGYGYHTIPLSTMVGNRFLTIKYFVSENNAFTSLTVPEIQEAGSVVPNFISENGWEIIISLFLTVFGSIAILFAVGLTFNKNRKVGLWKLMWLGAFAFFSGIYSMCATDILMLFTPNKLIRAYLEFHTLYLIPVCFIGYIFEEVKYGKKKIRRFCTGVIIFAQVVFWLVLFMGQCTNRFHAPALLTFNHIIDLTVVLYGITVYYLDWKRREGKSNWLLFGMLVLAFFAVEEVIRFNYEKYFHSAGLGPFNNFLFLAAFVFTVSLLVDYLSDVVYVLYNIARVRMVEEFAYMDELTHIGNRRATEEFYDKIDEKGTSYCLIEFDLNNLKMVNDSEGHEIGDDYIRAFSHALKTALDGAGYIGRTGGDEFVAVLTNARCLEFSYVETKLDALAKEIGEVNSKHPEWNMSAASGYCYSDEAGVKGIRDAFRIADSRMYENKKRMKR